MDKIKELLKSASREATAESYEWEISGNEQSAEFTIYVRNQIANLVRKMNQWEAEGNSRYKMMEGKFVDTLNP